MSRGLPARIRDRLRQFPDSGKSRFVNHVSGCPTASTDHVRVGSLLHKFARDTIHLNIKPGERSLNIHQVKELVSNSRVKSALSGAFLAGYPLPRITRAAFIFFQATSGQRDAVLPAVLGSGFQSRGTQCPIQMPCDQLRRDCTFARGHSPRW